MQVNPLLERFAALSRQQCFELTHVQSSLVLRFVKVRLYKLLAGYY